MRRNYQNLFLAVEVFITVPVVAGYLPYAPPMERAESTTQRTFVYNGVTYQPQVPKGQELFVAPGKIDDFIKQSTVLPKGSYVVYEPATKKFLRVPETFAAYLSPAKTVVKASFDQRVSFSSTSVINGLDPGQYAYEDDRMRVTVDDITKHIQVLVVNGDALLVKKGKASSSLNMSELHDAAWIESHLTDLSAQSGEAPIFDSAEDAANNRNPRYVLPKPDNKNESYDAAYIPPPPPFPKGAKALRGPLYDGRFNLEESDMEFLMMLERGEVDLSYRKIQNENPTQVLPPRSEAPSQLEAAAQVVEESLLPPAKSDPPLITKVAPDHPHRGKLEESFGYLQMVNADRNRAYAYAYRVLLRDEDANLEYLEKEHKLLNHPQLEEFIQTYVAALRYSTNAMNPAQYAKLMGMKSGLASDTDPGYQSAVEGLALDMVKRKYPHFWGLKVAVLDSGVKVRKK